MNLLIKLKHLVLNYRYRALLAALIGWILIAPFFTKYMLGIWFLAIAGNVILIVVVFSLIEKVHIFYPILALVIIETGLNIYKFIMPNIYIEVIYGLISAFVYGVAVYIISKAVFLRKQVDSKSIAGALDIYFLLGIIYGSLYWIVETIMPGSFQFNSQTLSHDIIDQFNLFYFSFTTLTTCGFGDIIPVTNYARSIVILEEVTGVLYLAVVVSKLVSGFEIKFKI